MRISDSEFRKWIRGEVRFDGRAVSDNLYLRFRPQDKIPKWRFRYSFKGLQRTMDIGNINILSRPQAEKRVRELAAQVTLGIDVAAEKQKGKLSAVGRIIAKREAMTFSELATNYYERKIKSRVKHPEIVLRLIENHLNPCLGKIPVKEINANHIDLMLTALAKKKTPSTSNKSLRLTQKILDHGIKTTTQLKINPASPFDISDAGGTEESRTRALSIEELRIFFAAMRSTQSLGRENYLAFCLLLTLMVRKMELASARWDEFDLSAGEWALHGSRTKTGQAIVIPLAPQVIGWLMELKRLSAGSEWVLPTRKMQTRNLPHISESTLSVALGKIKTDLPHFTVHDLRRTARSLLGGLKIDSHIAERCLNHKIKGVAGIYDRYDYFEERKSALSKLATLIHSIESAGPT